MPFLGVMMVIWRYLGVCNRSVTGSVVVNIGLVRTYLALKDIFSAILNKL